MVLAAAVACVTASTPSAGLPADPLALNDCDVVAWSGVADNGRQIFAGDADGGATISVSDQGDGPVATQNEQPAWSPDGEMLAWSGVVDGVREILVANISGLNRRAVSNQSALATAGNRAPAWSPDGSRLAWIGFDGMTDRLVIADPVGAGAAVASASLESVEGFDWHPDGGRLAVSASAGSGSAVFVVDVVNDEVAEISTVDGGPTTSSTPVWSRDGQHLAWSGWSGSRWDVYVAHADGSERSSPSESNVIGGRDSVLPAWHPIEPRLTWAAGLPFFDPDWGIHRAMPDGSDHELVFGSANLDGRPLMVSHSPEGRRMTIGSQIEASYAPFPEPRWGTEFAALTTGNSGAIWRPGRNAVESLTVENAVPVLDSPTIARLRVDANCYTVVDASGLVPPCAERWGAVVTPPTVLESPTRLGPITADGSWSGVMAPGSHEVEYAIRAVTGGACGTEVDVAIHGGPTLAVAAFEDCPAGPTPFTDLSSTSFAYADVGCIYSLGVTGGTSATSYSPGDPVTREQMAAFLARLFRAADGVCAVEDPPFTDVPVSSYAHGDVGCIYGAGITTGTSATTYGPTEPVTREQMAAFLVRLHRAVGDGCRDRLGDWYPFGDVDASSFAYEEIACLHRLGVTTGTGSGTYSPAAYVTREQMAAFLARLWRTLVLGRPGTSTELFGD